MSGSDAIRHANDVLARHSDLLVEAWERGGIVRDEDNARAVNALVQSRALVDIDGTFRLATNLKRHYDAVAHRSRSYAVGDDLRAMVDALLKNAASLREAIIDGRAEASAEFASDYQDALSDLVQSIDGSVAQLRALTDSDYGNVSSFADKHRQNDHYSERVRSVMDSLALIETSTPLREMCRDPVLESQGRMFSRQIGNRIGSHHATLMEVHRTLGENLYRIRRIGPFVRNIQRLALHMTREPEWRPPEHLPEDDPNPSWMAISQPIIVRSSPDALDPVAEPILVDVTQATARPADPTAARLRTTGTMEDDALEVLEAEAPDDPLLIAYDLMADAAQIEPASARAWHMEGRVDADLDIWLMFVQSQAAKDGSTAGCVANERHAPFGNMDGVMWLEDVVLEPLVFEAEIEVAA